MPNFKPVVRKDYTSKNGKARIYIQVPFKGQTRLLKTDYYIEPNYMEDNGKVKKSYANASPLNLALSRKVIKYEEIFINNPAKSMSHLMLLLKQGDVTTTVDFFIYLSKKIDILKRDKRFSYAGIYSSILNSLKDCTEKQSLGFNEIDSDFLKKYRDYMLSKGKSINTIKKYISNIGIVINNALSDKVINASSLPNRKIDIKEIKPMIHLLDIEDMKKLIFCDCPKKLQLSKDCFALSFYLMGLNIKDICYMVDADIHNGRLLYKRLKTKGTISIKIPNVAWKIINAYKGSKYIMSFLDTEDSYSKFKAFATRVNTDIKKIAKIAQVDLNLTHGYARHSWATIASSKALQIPLEVIDKAQGRKSGEMINRYVKYDLDRIDEANDKVIGLLYAV